MYAGPMSSLPAFLTTKLFVPGAQPKWVTRPRLLQRLDETRPLTLVTAPAGFGKTTLLAEWIANRSIDAAWISLDEGDNDPARFWTYFFTALQTARLELGELGLAQLPLLEPSAVTDALASLLNALATAPQLLVVVLDDYHVINAKAIHADVAYLIDHLPPQLRLILSTRSDPPLPLARLRARGQLLEVRAADLRFTPDEITVFFNRVMSLDVPSEALAVLEARTEGWIAGLQLAALSLRGRSDVTGYVQSFAGTHAYIIDYLVDEVLKRQPETVAGFLLQTSILGRLTGPLCAAVTERDDAQSMLEQLERANLFVVPLDINRQWYRYHHLFADVLRSILQRDRPEAVTELHRRAGQWYELNGFVSEAITHALAINDFQRAARLIEGEAEACLKRSEHTTLQRWLTALPLDIHRTYPRLRLYDASIRIITHELDEAERALRDAEVAIHAAAPLQQREVLLSEAAAIGVTLALNRNEPARTIELARQALAHLPADQLRLRGSLMLHLGVAYDWTGQLTESEACFIEATRFSEAAGDLQTTLLAISNHAAAEKMQGRYRQAAALYRRGLALDEQHRSARAPAAVYLYTDLAEVLYEWNDFDGAAVHLQEAIDRSERAHLTRALVVGLRLLARLRLGQGDRAAAAEVIERAVKLAREQQIPAHYASPAIAQQVKVWLATGQLSAAAGWARASGLTGDDELNKTREDEYLALVRVWLALNEPDRALNLLERLRRSAQARGRTESVWWVLRLQALAQAACGDRQTALATLAQVLTLTEPESFIRLYVDEGEPMQALIADLRAQLNRRASTGDVEVRRLMPYLDRVWSAFPVATVQAERPPQARPLVEALTDRELEVLRLVATGLSDKQIAGQLIIAVGTVKRHLNSAYGKLGVHNRTAALARARELGLL